ncbi:MAG: hypothetical protein ALECFALPRED_007421 [Alectoria fallacina]|uniref:Uncharacterized protein n=1 Tax=Alectoria fallacina TaxID=1903189 RepID=A0A8H3G7Y4_9LECA|nr:MAG: hypothetical protein ALECFALPRED_007421 [Alectoria fallacina]
MTAAPTAEVFFRYTALPAEIRNAIMHHALVPGDVYPSCPKDSIAPPSSSSRKLLLLRAVFRRPPPAPFRPKVGGGGGGVDHHGAATTTTKRPGFHLLTTCKQAYRDGRYMFYTLNTFHLPAGSARDAEVWLEHLRPDQRSLIKRAGLTLSLADLTPAVLAEMEKKWLWDIPTGRDRRHEERMVFEVAYLLCWRFWQDKIRALQRQQWPGLEEVVVANARGEVVAVFTGEAFRALGVEEERGVLDSAREVVRTELEGLVGEVGWKGARRWFLARGKGAGG